MMKTSKAQSKQSTHPRHVCYAVTVEIAELLIAFVQMIDEVEIKIVSIEQIAPNVNWNDFCFALG